MRKTIVALLVVAVAATGARPAAAAPSCIVTSTMRRGAVSSDVKCLESRLIELGYRVVGPDTSFGRSTDRAVRSFQKANDLVVDGIVGPRTSAALGIRSQAPPAPPVPTVPARVIETRTIGTSVGGRAITATRMGTVGGRVVLVVGVIHGDETKGSLITRVLRGSPTPKGVDLWLIDTINPDGMAAGRRTNDHDVDLNRNFEAGWEYIARSSEHHQYSGEQPADQPETQATEAFIAEIGPALTIWYHQDLDTVAGSSPTAKRYAQLTGMTTSSVGCTTKCTGTAGAFVKAAVPGSVGLLIELPSSSKVTEAMVRRHAAAVLAIAP